MNVAVVVADSNDKATLEIAKNSMSVEGLLRKPLTKLVDAWNLASSRPILSSVRLVALNYFRLLHNIGATTITLHCRGCLYSRHRTNGGYSRPVASSCVSGKNDRKIRRKSFSSHAKRF